MENQKEFDKFMEEFLKRERKPEPVDPEKEAAEQSWADWVSEDQED